MVNNHNINVVTANVFILVTDQTVIFKVNLICVHLCLKGSAAHMRSLCVMRTYVHGIPVFLLSDNIDV